MEIVQELLHVYGREAPVARDSAIAYVRSILELFDRCCRSKPPDARRAVELVERSAGLSARDAFHAAVCLRRGLDIISTDRDFDRVVGARRIDPASL